MDALIRSVTLAPFRTRLETAGAPASGPTIQSGQGGPDSVQSARDALRAEIEHQVRLELANEMEELYERERERARADGYAEGLEQANKAAADALERTQEQVRAQVDSALRAMEAAHQAALAKLESSVGEVAFAAVCRFVGRKAASHSFVLHLVEHACAGLRAGAVVTARMHPRDIHTLSELLHGSELRIQSLGVKLVPDDSLELGGCVIEADAGRYEGGIESQLRRLHAVLVGGSDTQDPNAAIAAAELEQMEAD